MGFEPPQRLVRALGETYGDAAAGDWLARLPEVARRAVGLRHLDVERVVAPGGRSSLVALVRLPDGTPGALKVAPPFAAPDLERAALAHWNGWGTVQLLDAAGPEAGAADAAGAEAVATDAAGAGLLLERLHTEVSLRSLPEAKALLEAAGTVRRLWVAPPEGHRFESVAERTARQAGAMRAAKDDETAALVSAALDARDALVADAPEELLLHGNFRQGKVLAGDRAPWLAVGPEPLVGERAYDLARLVRDRVEDLVAAASGATSGRRRVNKLADSLDVDRERLRGWTLFRAVESGTRALAAGRRQDGELLLEFAGWL
ncbi:aminoglycoside phosphotransferase family protein [Streptomyces lavendofoliae]|uniref:Kinase n=1 Tax=Streptomyces lavendofoliae TaxID=67314 RepID=A0A918M734_9ACTN|nr:aminoglycoside phosphotransferase family protein [Streptomyces lavendofoliae]GGU64816.1 kinase [Streptomyces lavendofoliae]